MFEDWGFWAKICPCCRPSSDGAAASGPGHEDIEGEHENEQLLDPEETADDSRIVDMSKCRIAANLSGIGVLVAITALIITFR